MMGAAGGEGQVFANRIRWRVTEILPGLKPLWHCCRVVNDFRFMNISVRRLLALLSTSWVVAALSGSDSLATVHACESLDVAGAVGRYGTAARMRIAHKFEAAGVPYPPQEMTWIALKEEKELLVLGRDAAGRMKLVWRYPIVGASGTAGPKLREGDKQVPEGFYCIARYRPDVVAHLGLEIDYPNREDRLHAKDEKRRNLGGDILIHGSRWSTGCLAMGNEPIEELFVLAYDTGCDKISLVFAPCNLLTSKPPVDFDKQPRWLPDLYERIRRKLEECRIAVQANHSSTRLAPRLRLDLASGK